MAADNEVDIESDGNSDTEDPKQHLRLLSAITRLDYKQRVKPPSRKEPSVQVSEFHLAKEKSSRKSNAVNVTELAGVLGKGSKTLVAISHKIKTAEQTAKTLSKPLERIHADKVKRSSGFEKAKEVLTVWEPLVQSNRVADQLSFPIQNNRIKVHETNIFTTAMEPKTDLEKNMHEVLMSSGYIQPQEEKVDDDFPLTLEEVLEQRRESARLKILVQRQQIKKWQQNRTKSKKFHRILRRERLKQQIKEFEALKETNPEEALKRLDQLERSRAQERASLRHRNTGAWARSKAIRAKYDRESRQVLSQQLAISRELTQKLKPVENSSDSDTEGEEEVPDLVPIPDASTENIKSEINNFVSGYRKFWEDSNIKASENKKSDANSDHHTFLKHQDLENLYADKNEDPISIENIKPKKGLKKKKNLSTESSNSGLKEKKRKPSKVKCLTGKWSVTESNDNEISLDMTSTKKKKKKKKKGSSPVKDSNDISPILPEKTVEKEKKTASKKGKESKSEDVDIVDLFTILPEKTGEKEKKTASKKGKESKSGDVDIVDLFTEFENKQEKFLSKSLSKLKKDSGLTDSSQKQERKNKTSNEPTNKKKANKKKANKKSKASVSDADIVVSLRPTPEERRAISFPLIEAPNAGKSVESDISKLVNIVKAGDSSKSTEPKKQLGAKDNIDPTKFLSAKPLKSRNAEMVSAGLEDLDDMEEAEAEKNRVDIAEAFADDDVVDEFRQEKEDLENASKPKEVDLVLPGWGEWGGSGIVASHRKRKRFILKPTEEAPRIDRDKRNVIIYEGKDSGLVKHLVSDLPYPFTSVNEFESSIRAPVGSTWIPETAHRKLTAPRVTTLQGQIIAPMTEDAIASNEELYKNARESKQRKIKQK